MTRKTTYDLGIIGGMGSEASVELYSRIINNTCHSCDQEHMKICVLNNSSIPDRTKCIIDGDENPVPYLNEAIEDLEKIGAKYFVMACNTAHKFIDELKNKKVELINMIDETLLFVKDKYKNRKVCVLSTNGTIFSNVYHHNKFAEGIDFVYLDSEKQNQIMNAINDTKSGVNKAKILESILEIIESVSKQFDCIFILACTELSLYQKGLREKYTVVDAMDCLVDAIIKKCGYRLKDK